MSLVTSLLPCVDKPSDDASSVVAVATAQFPSCSCFQSPLTRPERRLLEASVQGGEKKKKKKHIKLMSLLLLRDANDSVSKASTRGQNPSLLVDHPLTHPGTCLSLRGGCEV